MLLTKKPSLTITPVSIKRCCCLILLLHFLQLHAQDKKDIFKFSDYPEKHFKLPLPEKLLTTSMPFNSVMVKDARPDSNAILLNKYDYYTIAGLETVAGQYFNTALATENVADTNNQLVIFIKKLWITRQYNWEEASEDENELRHSKWLGGLLFKADCFLKTDAVYHPLFSYDTSFAMEDSYVLDDGPVMIDSCFRMLVQKLIRVQSKNFSSPSKKMTADEVAKYNNNRFQLPILKNNGLNRGVYSTFKEFKNNNPVYTDFTVQKSELTDELYIKDSAGRETLTRNVWGYCNGTNVFIKSADNFFMLNRIDNSFYMKGAKKIKSSKRVKASSILMDGFLVGSLKPHSTKVKFNIVYLPYQLDLDSGEIY